MPIRTARWNDPHPADGAFRLLVCRYRPRGVRKQDEDWDAWWPRLGPSPELHAARYGKDGTPPIDWSEYRGRYRGEMRSQEYLIGRLAARVRGGDAIVLLCSSACVDAATCHRTLLQELIEQQLATS